MENDGYYQINFLRDWCDDQFSIDLDLRYKQAFNFCHINFRDIKQSIYDRQYSTLVFTMTARCKTHRTTENNSFQRIDAGIE